MQWKICQLKIKFHTHILNYIQIDLIYAHQKMMLRLYKRLVYECYVMPGM